MLARIHTQMQARMHRHAHTQIHVLEMCVTHTQTQIHALDMCVT